MGIATVLKSWSCVKISGEMAEKFLQGQLTCDVTQVNARAAQFSACCNHQGRILATFFITKIQEDYVCILPQTICDSFLLHLKKYAVFSKVNVEDQSQTCFVLGGVNVKSEIIKQDFSYRQIVGTELCFIISANKSMENVESIFSETISIFQDESNWNLHLILAGFAILSPRTQATVTPHMLNLHLLGAVSFNKGCYVGQEIIARTQYLGKSKRHLYRCEATHPSSPILPGDPVTTENHQEVGVVISAEQRSPQHYLLLCVIQENAHEKLLCNAAELFSTITPAVA